MQVVTLAAASSGQGKTTLSAALGAALAAEGVSVALVDLDLEGAELHLRFGMSATKASVADLLRPGGPSISEIARRVPGHPGLRLVAGPRESLRARGLSEGETARLVEALRQLPEDVVIADLPSGDAPPCLDLLLAGDRQLVLTTPGEGAARAATALVRRARLRGSSRGAMRPAEPDASRARVYTSIDDLVSDLNALKERESAVAPPVTPSLVLTRWPEPGEAARRALRAVVSRELSETAEPLVLATLPEDAAVPRSERAQAPVVAHAPRSRASAAIVALARRIAAGETGGAALGVVEHAPRELKV